MDNKTSKVTEVSNPRTRETKILKQKLIPKILDNETF